MRNFSVVLFAFLSAPLWAVGTLDVYFIDVEGGQSTLFVSPSGEVHVGGYRLAGLQRPGRGTHCERRQDGGRHPHRLPGHHSFPHGSCGRRAATRPRAFPSVRYVDHGRSVETGKEADQLFRAYVQARDHASHLLVRPGGRIPVEGIDVRVVSAAGQEIMNPLSGAGQPNPYCAATKPRELDPSENAQSVGMLISYGRFRMIDLGDLTWNKELGLVCPVNKLGTVDVYLSTHHGLELSNAPAIVDALHPRVAITNNGATKGGSTWRPCKPSARSPGIEDVWQLHYAQNAGPETTRLSPLSSM